MFVYSAEHPDDEEEGDRGRPNHQHWLSVLQEGHRLLQHKETFFCYSILQTHFKGLNMSKASVITAQE